MKKWTPSVRTPTYTFTPGEHVRTLTPPWPDFPLLDPHDRYITTGEAVMKATYLRKEVAQLLRRCLELPPDHPFIPECIAALAEADVMICMLKEKRGKFIFLECESEGGAVRCRHTNPRERPLSRRDDWTPGGRRRGTTYKPVKP